jgi:hypothetical protein
MVDTLVLLFYVPVSEAMDHGGCLMGDGCAEVRTREITAGVAEVYADSEAHFLGQVFLVAG